MANVRVDVDYTLKDGQSIIFRAPCDCGSVSGIIIYYPELIDNEITTLSKVFSFRDSHNNDLAEINDLFSTGAYVHAILDTTNSYAYLQNADTNAYLEDKFKSGGTTVVPYNESKVATEGQTEFPIDLVTFDYLNDSVEVYSGRTRLSPNGDYTVGFNSVTLTEGVPAGRTVDIKILKNTKIVEGEAYISGSQITPGSITLDRLDNSDIGGKVKRYKFFMTSETDGQTQFTIPMDTFDSETDIVDVKAGPILLTEDEDFTVSGKVITLVEGVHAGCTIDIKVWKQAFPARGEEDYISGANIRPASIPLDRLAEAIQMDKAFIRHDTTGELYRIGLDDNGLYTVKQSES